MSDNSIRLNVNSYYEHEDLDSSITLACNFINKSLKRNLDNSVHEMLKGLKDDEEHLLQVNECYIFAMITIPNDITKHYRILIAIKGLVFPQDSESTALTKDDLKFVDMEVYKSIRSDYPSSDEEAYEDSHY